MDDLAQAVCSTCPYFAEGVGGLGQCRRWPPRLMLLEGWPPETIFPEVDGADWCGEHPARAKSR